MSDTPEPETATDDDRSGGDEIPGAGSGRPTGEEQAAENRENEPPA